MFVWLGTLTLGNAGAVVIFGTLAVLEEGAVLPPPPKKLDTAEAALLIALMMLMTRL
jgi:hypothetical protein